jgi:lipoate-protein ligase A
MAVDEAMLIALAEGRVPPTLRFYGWNPAALSIGYFQKVAEINREALEHAGYGFVRRPTGGRAVLHADELTYCLVIPEGHPLMPSSVLDAYRVICLGLLEGYRLLGVPAYLQEPVNTRADKERWSPACFDLPSSYELMVAGRKAAGSAQTRQRGVILQHGAILLDFDVESMVPLMAVTGDDKREQLRRTLSEHAVSLKEAAGRPVSWEEALQAFRLGFAKGLGVSLVEEALSAYEEQIAVRLMEEKYGNDHWNGKF